jgi:hypothetical protein
VAVGTGGVEVGLAEGVLVAAGSGVFAGASASASITDSGVSVAGASVGSGAATLVATGASATAVVVAAAMAGSTGVGSGTLASSEVLDVWPIAPATAASRVAVGRGVSLPLLSPQAATSRAGSMNERMKSAGRGAEDKRGTTAQYGYGDLGSSNSG